MNVFLRLKAWQIFLLVVAVPLSAHFFLISAAFKAADPKSVLQYYPWVMVLFAGVFFGWLYSLGIGLNKFTPPELRPSPIYFKITQVYAVTYIVLSQFYMYYLMTHFPEGKAEPIPGLLFPLHILAIFCAFYGFYFVAKNLIIANHLQKATFYDFSGPFFLLIIFPVGIWFLQPRINQIYGRART